MTGGHSSPVAGTGRRSLDVLRDLLAGFPLSIIQLTARIGVGSVFFKAGLLKYHSWDFTVLLFRDEYRVPLLDPATAARIAMVQELTVPILLFLGVATRLATLPLLGMIAVIQTFVYPGAFPDHLVWGSLLLLLLTRGPGVVSVDHFIVRALRGRAGQRKAPSRNATRTEYFSRADSPDIREERRLS